MDDGRVQGLKYVSVWTGATGDFSAVAIPLREFIANKQALE